MSRAPTSTEWLLACPACKTVLDRDPVQLRCPECGQSFGHRGNIWRFLPPERSARYEPFLQRYARVRSDEGWGVPTSDYFRALPRIDGCDPQADIWNRRQASYHLLTSRIVAPLAAALGPRLRIVDAGAGNCWLTHRLAELGHALAAVDISLDNLDGLGASIWYDASVFERVILIQAEYDRLPLTANQADLVIFNASLHYSAGIDDSLREALRVLRPAGRIAIMDSPVYRDSRAGELMIEEREAAFEARYGFPPSTPPMHGFLTRRRLAKAGDSMGIRWTFMHSAGPHRRLVSLARNRLASRREHATMPLVVGERI